MSAVSRRWITDRLTCATRACLARLPGGPGKRLHTLASQHDGPTAARPLSTPRPAPLSTLHVACDVQRGRCGIRPAGIVAPSACHTALAPGVLCRESERPLSVQRRMGA